MADKKRMGDTPTPASDKKRALDTAIAQIEREFGKGSIMRLGENSHIMVEAVPTGSLSLDIALGIGGVPKGRIVEIYGPESSGKTTLALHIVAEAQKLSLIHILPQTDGPRVLDGPQEGSDEPCVRYWYWRMSRISAALWSSI